MKKYLMNAPTGRKTSQSLPIPGMESKMAQNNAGGYVFKADSWQRLERFLILGTEGGSYYVSEKDLTGQNLQNVRACIETDGKRTVDMIVDISVSGRAPKNDPAIYALAIAASDKEEATRTYALSKLGDVCRIGTHLFSFCAYIDSMRGWGPALRKAVSNWYTTKEPNKLAYQLLKYQQRNGWSHRDVLRLAHPTKQNTAMMRWATSNPLAAREVSVKKIKRASKYPSTDEGLPILIQVFEDLKADPTVSTAVDYIEKHGLTHEMIPTELLKSPLVWEALLQKMPMMAMVRSLARMSAIKLLTPMSDASKLIVSRLQNGELIHKARIHPVGVLLALGTYQAGHGMRGHLEWTAVPQIVSALDDAFYQSFDNVQPTGKNFYMGVDVSGSMSAEFTTGITAAKAAAAMAMVVARVEPNYFIGGFSTRFVDLKITAKDSLTDVMKKTADRNFGGTDTSVAINHAKKDGFPVDCFVIISDGETWAGDIHTSQALELYRRERNRPQAKLAVINMTANRTSLADPDDLGQLNMVGFDTSVPTVLREFVGGKPTPNGE